VVEKLRFIILLSTPDILICAGCPVDVILKIVVNFFTAKISKIAT